MKIQKIFILGLFTFLFGFGAHAIAEACQPQIIDVCTNLEGVQAETPDGYTNVEGTCSPVVVDEPKDYCDTLEGVQAEDEDCPAQVPTPVPTPEDTTNHNEAKEAHPAVCNGVFPDKPIIIEANYVKTGGTSAHFEFWGVKSDRYVVEYGYSKDNLPYGIEGGLPGSSQVEVRGFDLNDLKPGFNTLFARVTAKLGECYTPSEVAN